VQTFHLTRLDVLGPQNFPGWRQCLHTTSSHAQTFVPRCHLVYSRESAGKLGPCAGIHNRNLGKLDIRLISETWSIATDMLPEMLGYSNYLTWFSARKYITGWVECIIKLLLFKTSVNCPPRTPQPISQWLVITSRQCQQPETIPLYLQESTNFITANNGLERKRNETRSLI
jgi:hypothetical protein